ncbi:ABC transporter permease [Rhodococcoides kyotonense]|uniref:Peptide/nickel transport system permease protein n=1 Tax=Rhodococcoides kyotonense TaxID=398843 RepID=A0A239N0A3_9NOCA|nr:ABC transporter permease [Rhodococcus kyotonensis]SNT47854.1 peptide/nickel transport system permease protein [Rhodococcus kyotonensis]
MTRLIVNRVLFAIPVLLLMSIITYFLVSLIPGDAATVVLGEDATPERIAALNAQLNLDKPFYVQWWYWLTGAVHGDLGTSLYTGEDVSRVITQRVWPTVYVAGLATIAATVIGVVLGTWAAVKRGVWAKIVDVVAMCGISLPNFWIALLLVVLIAGRLELLPPLGYVPPQEDTSEFIRHIILPVSALAVAGIAIIAKQTRDSMAQALSRDFMKFMQANGISTRSLIFRHGLRHAAVAILTAMVACFVNLFGGTVALEAIFALPGLGSLVVITTTQHDLVTIQGAVLAYTVVVLAATLFGDIAHALLNPKARTQ